MFDKMLSKIGIGAAKVDTVLHTSEVMRGEMVTGEIHLTGGKTAQEINKIYLELQTNYLHEHDEGVSTYTHTLHRVDIAEKFVLNAGEEVIYDFELEIPLSAPISFGHTHSWIKTGLDVSFAFDPKDHDNVVITPDPATAMVLDAAENLGFQHTHHSGRCLGMHTPYGVPFVQEFELRGTGPIGRLVEELELLIVADAHEAHVQMEIDKRNHGVMGWIADEMDLDETKVRYRVPHNGHFSASELEQMIRNSVH